MLVLFEFHCEVLVLTSSATKKYSDVSCGRSHEDNSLQIIVTTPLFGALALLIWILRLVSRYLTGFRATWGMDDWIMVPVVVSGCDTVWEAGQLTMTDRIYTYDMSILDPCEAWSWS
jgi:hypothetical protein